MPIAIHIAILPGRTMLDRFENARAVGIEGIEFGGFGLAALVDSIVEASTKTGVRAVMVDHTESGSLLDPDEPQRERALAELRRSVANAVDIGAQGVVFTPHYGAITMPDLTPYMSSIALEAEMLHMHLRTLSDFAYAMGSTLYIQPLERTRTHFLNRVEQAARVARRINHPHVKVAVNFHDMMREETDIASALTDHADVIGYVRVTDTQRRLPGQGSIDYAALAPAFKILGDDVWVTVDYDPALPAERMYADLPASLDMLRRTRIIA